MKQGLKCLQIMVSLVIVLSLRTTTCFSEEQSEKHVGIYVYETIEGSHTVSSALATKLSNKFLELFGSVTAVDKVPLESNETVRILQEMTEGRQIVVTTLSTWLTGGVVAAPTLKFADDSIKFKDLTWHVNQDSVAADAALRQLNYVLIGSVIGQVSPVRHEAVQSSGRELVSVTVIANVRLLSVANSSVIWADTFRETSAGFDYQVAFDRASTRVADTVKRELSEHLAQQ